ncbi:MAG TPA: hypothetical protein VH854_15775, partial [Thermoanaerobaculia bacterium]|nr:hypothetical protein [Thermoanaerobaculia bacterium]
MSMPLLVALWLAAAGAAERAPIAARPWTPIGPTDGAAPVAIASVAFDAVSGMLYAGSAVDPSQPLSTRVFRRPVSGGEWIETKSPDLGGLYPYVEVTTDGAGFLYASVASCLLHPGLGCSGALARSGDTGEHWIRLLTGATSSVAVDPFDASLVLAVESSEAHDPMFPADVTIVQTALSSRDGGATWTEDAMPPSPSSFAFDPSRGAP